MRNKDGKLGRFADVVSDAGFKAVFCDRENKDVVRDLLNVFMPPGREVASFRLMRTELPGKTDKNKTIRIDLRCVTVEGTEIIIEMQNYSQQYFFRRCLYYASKVYESKLKAGKKKKQGEYVITTRNANTGKTSKAYANSLTENERVFAKSSKYCFEDDICVAWVN